MLCTLGYIDGRPDWCFCSFVLWLQFFFFFSFQNQRNYFLIDWFWSLFHVFTTAIWVLSHNNFSEMLLHALIQIYLHLNCCLLVLILLSEMAVVICHLQKYRQSSAVLFNNICRWKREGKGGISIQMLYLLKLGVGLWAGRRLPDINAFSIVRYFKQLLKVYSASHGLRLIFYIIRFVDSKMSFNVSVHAIFFQMNLRINACRLKGCQSFWRS